MCPLLQFIGEQDWFYPIKQDSRFCLANSRIQARIKNLFNLHLNFKQDMRIHEIKISISSKIREFRLQNLDYKQNARMTKSLDLTAKESKIHIQLSNIH